MGQRILITQSSYIPWRGWFEMAASCDALVLYDTVQFTKRDWRSRNRIRSQTGEGWSWLTIPVHTKGQFNQAIKDVRVSDPDWWTSHLSVLHHTYARYPGYPEFSAELSSVYRSNQGEDFLSRINERIIRWLCTLLDISVNILSAETFLHEGSPSERLGQIASQLDADTYVTGPAASAYLEVSEFTKRGIEVEYFSYDGLPSDPVGLVDEHPLSILDTLSRLGVKDTRLLIPSSGTH